MNVRTTMATAKEFLSTVGQEFGRDNAMQWSAALAYYTVFSIAPLLVLATIVLGTFVDPEDVQGEIARQISTLIGPSAAEQVQVMIESTDERAEGNVVGTVIGIVALLFGASNVMIQLQNALNEAWNVAPAPDGGARQFIVKRLFSFAMVMSTAFLLLVSLIVSTVLSAVGPELQQFLPQGLSSVAVSALTNAVNFAVIVVLFAAIFKVVPDAHIAWRDVWFGSVVTALLFVAGKWAIGFYLGQSNVANAYGAASSLAVILVWVYYTAVILFLGAECAQVYARMFGDGIQPERGAIRVFRRKGSARSLDKAQEANLVRPPPS